MSQEDRIENICRALEEGQQGVARFLASALIDRLKGRHDKDPFNNVYLDIIIGVERHSSIVEQLEWHGPQEHDTFLEEKIPFLDWIYELLREHFA